MRKHQSLNGKPIRDANEALQVKVTRRDVSKAKVKDPTTCAIARGVSHLKDVVSVRIGKEIALVEYKDEVVRYGIKPEDQKKIAAFDNTRYFQPDNYELVPPLRKLGPSTKSQKRKRKPGSSGPSGPTGGVKKQKPLRHMWRAVSE